MGWLRRRRTMTRVCDACGYTWSVPRALRRPQRPGKWRSGIQPADLGPSGGLFPSEIRWALDQAAQRRREDESGMALRSRLATCAQCGSTHWHYERPQRRA